NLTVGQGEIVGLSGLVGSGQTTLLKRIFASKSRRRSNIKVNGRISYVSGDRAREGVFSMWSIRDNITISSLRELTKYGLVNGIKTKEIGQKWFERLSFRAESIDSPITSLSGGNQQKALIARGLASGADLLLLNDPTAGVDVETKQEIYSLLQEAKQLGKAIILHSTEDAEMEICDRVYVMRDGEVVQEFNGDDVSVKNIVRAAFTEVDRTVSRERIDHSVFSRIMNSRLTLPLSAMILIYGLNVAANSNVFSMMSIGLLLGTAVPLVFAALGQMFVITAGDIDMGNGYSIALANVLVAVVLSKSVFVGVVSLVILILAYVAMGALIHLRRLPAIVVTLGAQFIWLGVALLISPEPGGESPEWLNTIYNANITFIPMVAIFCLAAGIATWFIIYRWRYGIVLRGIGNSQDAVERAGWSYLVGKSINYAFAGLMVVFAGMAFTAVTSAADVNTSASFCMMSIATVIVGGCEMSGGVVEPFGVVAAGIAMSLIASLLITAATPLLIEFCPQLDASKHQKAKTRTSGVSGIILAMLRVDPAYRARSSRSNGVVSSLPSPTPSPSKPESSPPPPLISSLPTVPPELELDDNRIKVLSPSAMAHTDPANLPQFSPSPLSSPLPPPNDKPQFFLVPPEYNRLEHTPPLFHLPPPSFVR
ncbi:MAG: ATP-binding cassette domain-containing protein, partial [Verrucomicrobia bacterium]|nr:ATP-binding cassette domain-containing protein [Verrucomicrobiota bacterium]